MNWRRSVWQNGPVSGTDKLLIGMVLAIVFGILITFWAYLHVLYDMGVASKARGWIVYMGWETFNRLQTWLVSPRETSVPELGVIGSRFSVYDLPDDYENPIFVVAPTSCRLCVSQRHGMGRLWFTIFLGWLAKGDRVEDWWCETLPTSNTLLFGVNLRGLHTSDVSGASLDWCWRYRPILSGIEGFSCQFPAVNFHQQSAKEQLSHQRVMRVATERSLLQQRDLEPEGIECLWMRTEAFDFR